MIRLNKYIADSGVCSRREADKLIKAGVIYVNGAVVTELGIKVSENDQVIYKGKVLKCEKLRYILLNKPKDYITTVSDTHERKKVMDLIKGSCSERLYPVGRLDKDTTGLLIITNDGELTKKLTHPKYGVKKKYIAELDNTMHPDEVKKLTDGVLLDDGMSSFDQVEYGDRGMNKRKLVITIHSGKNRIVRRMIEYFGLRVITLDRIEFSGLKKGELTRGKWRFLTTKEIGFLKMIKSPE